MPSHCDQKYIRRTSALKRTTLLVTRPLAQLPKQGSFLVWKPLTCSEQNSSQPNTRPTLLDEVLRNQGNHCMWGNAHIESWEAGVEAQRAALSQDRHCTIDRARVLELACGWVWLLRLHQALHKIKWQREGGRKEARDRRCPKDLSLACDPHPTKCVLCGCIKGQHAEIQGHCSCSRWHASCHEATGTFFAHDHTDGL